MDAYYMAFNGSLFFTGGVITFVLTSYAAYIFSIFIITEVFAASLVTVFGVCLLKTSFKKMDDSIAETEEENQSGRISPFYYELESIIQKRDLPPIPRDIGREYNPDTMDKV